LHGKTPDNAGPRDGGKEKLVFAGRVRSGRGLGRRLGFPTVNLDADACFAGAEAPASGVYTGRVDIDGRRFPAAVFVGPRPTTGDGQSVVEAHLLGYDGDAVGREVTVSLGRFLREAKRFDSVESLRRQIAEDVRLCALDAAGGDEALKQEEQP